MFSLIFILISFIRYLLKLENSNEGTKDNKLSKLYNNKFIRYFNYESLGFSRCFHVVVDILEFLFYVVILNFILNTGFLGLSLLIRLIVVSTYRLVRYLFF